MYKKLIIKALTKGVGDVLMKRKYYYMEWSWLAENVLEFSLYIREMNKQGKTCRFCGTMRSPLPKTYLAYDRI